MNSLFTIYYEKILVKEGEPAPVEQEEVTVWPVL
jgi:hypothetical protein